MESGAAVDKHDGHFVFRHSSTSRERAHAKATKHAPRTMTLMHHEEGRVAPSLHAFSLFHGTL